MPTVLVTRTHAEHHTQVVRSDDAISILADLRARTDGDIGVGGATLATALLRAGMLDELERDLLEQAHFDKGATLHQYAVRNVQA